MCECPCGGSKIQMTDENRGSGLVRCVRHADEVPRGRDVDTGFAKLRKQSLFLMRHVASAQRPRSGVPSAQREGVAWRRLVSRQPATVDLRSVTKNAEHLLDEVLRLPEP